MTRPRSQRRARLVWVARVRGRSLSRLAERGSVSRTISYDRINQHMLYAGIHPDRAKSRRLCTAIPMVYTYVGRGGRHNRNRPPDRQRHHAGDFVEVESVEVEYAGGAGVRDPTLSAGLSLEHPAVTVGMVAIVCIRRYQQHVAADSYISGDRGAGPLAHHDVWHPRQNVMAPELYGPAWRVARPLHPFHQSAEQSGRGAGHESGDRNPRPQQEHRSIERLRCDDIKREWTVMAGGELVPRHHHPGWINAMDRG